VVPTSSFLPSLLPLILSLDLANTSSVGHVGRRGTSGGDVLALKVAQEARVGAGVDPGAAVGVDHAVAADGGLAGGVGVTVRGGEHLARLGRRVDDVLDVLECVALEEDVGTRRGLEGLWIGRYGYQILVLI
jgi:hypothetical protein